MGARLSRHAAAWVESRPVYAYKLSCYIAIMLSCYIAIMLYCYIAILLYCYHAILLSCYIAIMLSCYHDSVIMFVYTRVRGLILPV